MDPLLQNIKGKFLELTSLHNITYPSLMAFQSFTNTVLQSKIKKKKKHLQTERQGKPAPYAQPNDWGDAKLFYQIPCPIPSFGISGSCQIQGRKLAGSKVPVNIKQSILWYIRWQHLLPCMISY